MFKTYDLMCSLRNEQLIALPINDLVSLYQETDKARLKSKYYANVFCRFFPMILKITQKYGALTNEQKVEETLRCLLLSMNNFSGRKAKFITYFYGNLHTKLTGLVKRLQCDNKKVWTELYQGTQEEVNRLLNLIPDKSNNYDISEVIDNSSILNKDEKLLCKLYSEGFYSNKDILKRMSLLGNLYSSDSELIKNICRSRRLLKNDFHVTKPLQETKILNGIKESLKKKLIDNNYQLI